MLKDPDPLRAAMHCVLKDADPLSAASFRILSILSAKRYPDLSDAARFRTYNLKKYKFL